MTARYSSVVFLCVLLSTLLFLHTVEAESFPADAYPSRTRLFGVTYSPFALNLDSICLPTAQVRSDMNIISQVADHLRLYNLNGCPEVTQTILSLSRQNGIRVIIGLYLSGDQTSNENEIRAVGPIVSEFGNIIDAVVVGNEVLFLNIVPLYDLIDYIERVKEIVISTGFRIPVTTADVWPVYESAVGSTLIDATDFICMNMQPFWEGWEIVCPPNTECTSAGNYVHAKAEGLQSYFGKPVWICETGWPTEGERCCEGRQFARDGLLAGPSESNATIFIDEIVRRGRESGRPTYIHAIFDEDWKRIWAPCGTCEGLSTQVVDPSCNTCELDYHFGLYGYNRIPKPGVRLPGPPAT